MIVQKLTQIPKIDGVIFIDCWESPAHKASRNNVYYIQLVNEILKHPIQSVVNAAYSVELSTKDISIRNTFEAYCWGKNQDTSNNTEIILNLIKNCSQMSQTSTVIQETIFRYIPSYMLLEFKDFFWHWKYNLQEKVNNWLIVGGSWNICLHHRPMGLNSIFSSNTDPKLNFYVMPHTVLNEHGETLQRNDFEKDTLYWQEIPNFGYRFVTRADPQCSMLDFTKKFMHDGKLKLTVRCTAATAQFLPTGNEAFDIDLVIEEPDWEFGFSRLVGEYNEQATTQPLKLQIWVFDITEPLDINKLLSYATPSYSAYHTEDKKIVMFENSWIGSIKIIENFVK